MFLSAGKQLSGQVKFQLEINKIDFVMKKIVHMFKNNLLHYL